LHKPDVLKRIFVTLMLPVILIMVGCGSATGNNSGDGPAIASVVAEHTTLYPLGNTNITCSAVSKNGSALNYRWISNEGTIAGNGPTINWEAPKTYGDFHIMVIVDDGNGHSSSGTATVTVIVRDPTKCCK